MRLKLVLLPLALLAAACAAMAQSGAAPSFDLSAAMAKAVANQPLILQAESVVAAARSREDEAKSAYLPNVSGAASYLYLYPQEGIDIPHLGSFNMTPLNMWDFHVAASELVYDFGRREIQVKLAESSVDAAAIGLDQIKTSIAFQTAQTFYSVIFLHEELKVLDEQIATLEQHLNDTKLREATGSSTHYDVLTTEVRVASVRSQRIDAAGQYEKQRIALRELLGLDSGADFEVKGDFAPQKPVPDDKAAVSAALSQRSDLAQSLAAEEQAELGLNLARLGHMPTISAEVEAGYKNGLLTAADSNVNDLLFNWNAGVMLNVPIFDSMLTERRGAEAGAKLAAARKGTDALRQSVTTQVLQAMQDVASNHDQTANSLVQLDQAQEALNMAKIQYDIGVGTNLEYLDSQTSLELAKLSNLGAVFREVLSQLQLKQAMGEQIWKTAP